MALVSAAHTAYAGNQDTYVGRLYLPHDKGVEKDEGRLALLVDRYSGAGERIRRSALVEHRELEMRVRRDESCDRRAREVTLKAKGAEVYRDDLRGILAGAGGGSGADCLLCGGAWGDAAAAVGAVAMR